MKLSIEFVETLTIRIEKVAAVEQEVSSRFDIFFEGENW